MTTERIVDAGASRVRQPESGMDLTYLQHREGMEAREETETVLTDRLETVFTENMTTESTTAHIVGPYNCPRCIADQRADRLRDEIALHVHSLDCGEEYERFGAMRRKHCSLRWQGGAIERLSRTQSAAVTLSHHCQPHRCDFGSNCGSYIGFPRG